MPTSYNGWSASRNPADFGGLVPLRVGTETFPPGVRAGDVAVVLQYVATQLDARVEPVAFPGGHPADDWGYNYRPSKNSAALLSCHASATAFDYNATRHPNGKRGTFTKAQVAEIRRILAEAKNVVRWGGDFTGTPDEMHFEIDDDAAAVAQVAALLRGGNSATPTAPGTENEMSPAEWDKMQKMLDSTIDARLAASVPPKSGVPFYQFPIRVLLAGIRDDVGASLALLRKIADKAGVKP